MVLLGTLILNRFCVIIFQRTVSRWIFLVWNKRKNGGCACSVHICMGMWGGSRRWKEGDKRGWATYWGGEQIILARFLSIKTERSRAQEFSLANTSYRVDASVDVWPTHQKRQATLTVMGTWRGYLCYHLTHRTWVQTACLVRKITFQTNILNFLPNCHPLSCKEFQWSLNSRKNRCAESGPLSGKIQIEEESKSILTISIYSPEVLSSPQGAISL